MHGAAGDSYRCLPAWCRRSPKITEVLPLLCLPGLSGGDFVPALQRFLWSSAGLSASTVTRLTEQWQDEQKPFACRDLSAVDYLLWGSITSAPAYLLGSA
jgi:putative transposase